MSLIQDNGDAITPSILDVRLLLALLDGRQNAYQIARQAESDSGNGFKIPAGTYQGSLKRLLTVGLILRDDNLDYELTTAGQHVLELELARYAKYIKLAKRRAENQAAGQSLRQN